MDQARDAMLITRVVENGPLALPLLGPRAGATEVANGYLRLGPIFYYFQYIAGLIFGTSDPAVFAYPDLLFSIAIIPLLYAFLRIYFSRNISLAGILMYSFSFIVIQYSRFAWNPNSLSFFTVLSFFGLVKFLNSENNEKRKRWWLVVWSGALTIGSQLHFFGFLSLVGASGLVILFHYAAWRITSWKQLTEKASFRKFASYVAIVAVTFGILYTPVIASDVIKKGENVSNFYQAFFSKPSDKPLADKLIRNGAEQLRYYCLITTSNCLTKKWPNDIFSAWLTVAVVAAGIFFGSRQFKKADNQMEKDFLFLVFAWISVFFILTIPVSYQLRPRFFIFVFPIPFILISIILKQILENIDRKKSIPLAIALVLSVLGMNAAGTYAWFREQTLSQREHVETERTLILKNKDGVTLGQLEKVVNFMFSNWDQKSSIYFYVKPEHTMPIKFLLYQKQHLSLSYSPMKIDQNPAVQFFAIVPSDSNLKPFKSKFGKDFEVVRSEQFGQLSVYQVNFNNRPVSAEFRFNRMETVSDRLFWADVFGIETQMKIEGAE